MTLRRCLVPLSLAFLGTLLVATPLARPVQDGSEHADSPLGAAMEGLQSAVRRLRKLIEQPDNRDACLEVVRGMQANALEAFGHPPDLPLGEDATPVAWRVGFQRQILALLDQLLVLELAVDEGRVDDAKAAYGELSRIKGEGHDLYQREE